MNTHIKNNKGIALILALGLSSILLTLGIAYVGGSIQENNLSQRYQDSVTALYEAERGMAYAFVEAQNAGYNWFTHIADNTNQNKLIANPNNTLTANNLLLRGAGATMDANGNYYLSLGKATIEARVYANPDNSDEAFILSRATVGPISRILKTKFTRRSLYKYLFYYPGSQYFSSGRFDGKNAGGIYVNGNIILGGNPTFVNMNELTTNSQGALYVASNTYDSPDYMSSYPYLPSLTGSHEYSSSNPYPWRSWKWPNQYWPPYDWMNVKRHFSYPGSVNGVGLPRTLSTEWQWKKYYGGNSNKQVVFRDPQGNPASASYWASLASAYGVGAFDPDFWQDKTYSQKKQYENVTYLNTAAQSGDWQNWLDSAGSSLKGVVKEGNTGGYDTAILNIEKNYSQLAKDGGLYIGMDDGGSLEVCLNGSCSTSLPCWVKDNVSFFNTIRPHLDNKDNPVAENVLELDIGQGLSCGELPNNNVVYVANKNIRLVNGKKLPAQGLTIASPYSVYIKGNYNYDPTLAQEQNEADWQPSSVISNSYVYVLSDAFNDPQALPAAIQPLEYPYELSYVNMGNFVPVKPAKGNDPMKNLEKQIEKNFGLSSSFDISSPGMRPSSPSELQGRIRSHYYSQYASTMPDQASPTTMKVAIASPQNVSPVSWDSSKHYYLERWYSGAPKIEGAFIRLSENWANDASGNPIQDIPALYQRKRTAFQGPGGMANRASDSLIYRPSSLDFEYEDRFATGETPPADLFGGSQASWQEVSDFDQG